MNVQFNGNGFQASMNGMPDGNKVDTSLFNKLRHGTVIAGIALGVAVFALGVFLIGWIGSKYYLDVMPQLLQELMLEIGILEYIPVYFRTVFGITSILMSALSAILMGISAFMLVKGNKPMTNSVRWTGVICDAVSVAVALVVVIVAAISFAL